MMMVALEVVVMMIAVAAAAADDGAAAVVVTTKMVADFPLLFPFVCDDCGWPFQLEPMRLVKMTHTTMPVAETIHSCWRLVNKWHRDVLLHREMPLQTDYI